MPGIVDLNEILRQLNPSLVKGEFVFCCVSGSLSEYLHLAPTASFAESEGLTLILPKDVAQTAQMKYQGVYRQITLKVHSSLDAVGLTSAVSTTLASGGVSANIVAAYYHDHVFVETEKAEQALRLLQNLAGSCCIQVVCAQY